MRIYAILADDKKNALCESAIKRAMEELQKEGHEIDFLDLYSRYKEIPFYFSAKKDFSNREYPALDELPFFQENKTRFMAADRLILAYPIYWYSTPGIMKCWIDLITNFAWKYKGGRYAKPLHKIKKTLILTSSGSPTWYLKYILLNCSFKPIKETFKWMGIPKNDFYNIGKTHGISDETVAKHLENIALAAKKLI